VGRQVCDQCERPWVTCLCQFVEPVENSVSVLILQHSSEVGHAKGTARLAQLSLIHSELWVGEQFSEQVLQGWCQKDDAQTFLLFPPLSDWQGELKVLPEAAPELNAHKLRVIVLDGTWKKSKKLIYQNPFLQTLPRLSFSENWIAQKQGGDYVIRKAPFAHSLSTIEAVAYALGMLEQDLEKYQPLLHLLQALVKQRDSYAARC